MKRIALFAVAGIVFAACAAKEEAPAVDSAAAPAAAADSAAMTPDSTTPDTTKH